METDLKLISHIFKRSFDALYWGLIYLFFSPAYSQLRWLLNANSDVNLILIAFVQVVKLASALCWDVLA